MKASSEGGLGSGLYLGREERAVGIGSASALEDGGQGWGCAGGAPGLGKGRLHGGSRDGKNPGLPEYILQWCHRLLEASSLLSTLSTPSLGEAGSVDLHLPPAGLSELSFH